MLPSFTKKVVKFLKKLMKKIAIIGAGISGLFIANLFKKIQLSNHCLWKTAQLI